MAVMATTLVTPAENRFFLLSESARRQSSLQQISQLLREHVTIKADSPFLKATVRNLIVQNHAAWLTACSHEWQLLARLPYVVNQNDERRLWQHCELCHKPVRYEYHVQNKHNHQEIVVGSECVKKFMNAETRYLMVITTEDNFYAVQQYQTLTSQLPTVPVIMFKQPWFPDLPVDHRPQARQLRQTTTQTVTTYLKRRTQRVPLRELKPAAQTYQQLVQTEQQARAAVEKAANQQIERAQQQQQRQAQEQAATAEQNLRASRPYQQYLHRLAAIIVTRPERATAKQRFDQQVAPATTKPLVNSYQFGQMVTEYRQTGHIQVKRLAMLDHQFVHDLDQVTRRLDAQQTTRFYDDVFNSCWGWDYRQSADQRADWQALLATRWATTLSLADLTQLATLNDADAIQKWLLKQADEPLRVAILARLQTHPQLTVIARDRLTKKELRTFCQRELNSSPDMVTFTHRFDQHYQLPATQQAELHETLAYYYVAHQHPGDHQAALKRLQWLLAKTN